MKIKTSELTGQALDWAVAKAESRVIIQFLGGGILVNGRTELGAELDVEQGFNYMWHPSSSWSQGGPIIEREGVNIENNPDRSLWLAWTPAPEQRTGEAHGKGPTPLIAAMRCYVASKLGDEVEVPDELA